MEIHTILLPTDFSTYAEHACQQEFTLAARKNAHVLLLHVLLRSDLAFGNIPFPIQEQAEKEMQAGAEHRLKTLASSRTASVETSVVWGSPAAEICRVAKERGVDLIVMSTHGRTGLAHLFIGSVAERVVRHALCSVLVVRGLQKN
jgi:nucleotide-binding universal stress UspA family protein